MLEPIRLCLGFYQRKLEAIDYAATSNFVITVLWLWSTWYQTNLSTSRERKELEIKFHPVAQWIKQSCHYYNLPPKKPLNFKAHETSLYGKRIRWSMKCAVLIP